MLFTTLFVKLQIIIHYRVFKYFIKKYKQICETNWGVTMKKKWCKNTSFLGWPIRKSGAKKIIILGWPIKKYGAKTPTPGGSIWQENVPSALSKWSTNPLFLCTSVSNVEFFTLDFLYCYLAQNLTNANQSHPNVGAITIILLKG